MACKGCLLLGVLLASGAAGCLLYTEKINHAPRIEKVLAPDVVHVNTATAFEAVVFDEDQPADALTLEWWLRSEMCPPVDSLAEARRGQLVTSGRGSTFARAEIERSDPSPFCLTLAVTDDNGATAFTSVGRRPVGQDPEPKIEIIRPSPAGNDPFVLYSTVQLSGSKSTDPDQPSKKPTLRWVVKTPNGAERPAEACSMVAEDVCVTLAEPGSYQVTLTAIGALGGMKQAIVMWTAAEDGPPCIRVTKPAMASRIVHNIGPDASTLDDDGTLRFTLLYAYDDGDPYPLGEPPAKITYSYRWANDKMFQRVHGPGGPGVSFPRAWLKPMVLRDLVVRLRYDDRKTAGVLDLCNEDEPFCEVTPHSGCYQWITWTVSIQE